MDKVKIGVIGTGKFGRKNIHKLVRTVPNLDLIAILQP